MSLPKLTFSEIKELCSITGASPTELPELFDSGDWSLLTDSEADARAREYIEDSLWTFTPEFLAWVTDLRVEVFRAIEANGRCESNNDALLSLVKSTCGIAILVASAIQCDGRGHFVNTYDGEEYEVGSYYLYRHN